MKIAELKAVRAELDRFVSLFDDCINTKPGRKRLSQYVRGQLSELPSKSVVPMALEVGVPPRSLQEFLEFYRWDEKAVEQRVQELAAKRHPCPESIGVTDETSDPKKGSKTAGVKRQYCGATGKIDNCVVSVHLGYVTPDFRAMVASDLYIPEDWLEDRPRCREAGIPEHLAYRPKWEIALEQIQRAKANGLVLKYHTADEEYGRCEQFRSGLSQLQIVYVVEVPCDTSGWTTCPPVVKPEEVAKPTGRKRSRVRLAPQAPSAQKAEELAGRKMPRWEPFYIKDTQQGPVVWEVKRWRFYPWVDGLPGPESWLVIARSIKDGELKYFLSNAPMETPMERLLGVAFSRAWIERLFQDLKAQVGLDQFQVRRYQPVLRHLILSIVSLMFLAEQVQKFRGKKSLVVHRADAPSGRNPTGSRTEPRRTEPAPPEAARQDHLPSEQ